MGMGGEEIRDKREEIKDGNIYSAQLRNKQPLYE
jgi:hypothetical protein